MIALPLEEPLELVTLESSPFTRSGAFRVDDARGRTVARWILNGAGELAWATVHYPVERGSGILAPVVAAIGREELVRRRALPELER